jgi:hypothetical protein
MLTVILVFAELARKENENLSISSSLDVSKKNSRVTVSDFSHLLDTFHMGLFKRSTKGQSAACRSAKPPQPQTFILEPILTPSGLVAGEDPDQPSALVDLVKHPAVDLGMEPADVPADDLSLHSSGTDAIAHSEIQPLAFVEHPLDAMSSASSSASSSPFTSGVFTVGESGFVSVDYLFDGGGYKGELAFFSLEGMEQFEPGSQDFIREAAQRALSDSELGHIVIRDAGEGAKFSAKLSYEQDFNRGNYLGEKTVHMAPGSKFGVMLVPNGTVKEVFARAELPAYKQPLFSMATANPDDHLYVGQIGDVTGDGHTFSFEDKRLDLKSDQDYNDVVFHVKGAIGQAETLDELINVKKDWRSTTFGTSLIDYVKAIEIDGGDGGETDGGDPDDGISGGTDGGNSGGGTNPGTGTGSTGGTGGTGQSTDNGGSSGTDPGNGTGTENSSGGGQTDSGTGGSSGGTDSTGGVTGSGNTGSNPGQGTSQDFPLAQQPLVGIIDTGFASNNPDINYAQILLGRDYVGQDADPFLATGEGSQHGTHILGIIKATQGNGIGIDGVNDDVPVWISRATGSGQWAEALKEFVDAAKQSGQPNAIVNLSFDLTQTDANGLTTTRYEFTPYEREAIEYARQNNVLIVAAAGNDGGVMSVLGQASKEFDNILTVGAADDDRRADYSSYGEGLDLLAPGGTSDRPITSTVENGLGVLAGTSVATAQVTGVASQVWAANPALSYVQVMNILKSTATDLLQAGWDDESGFGLVNATEAISRAKMTTPEPYSPSRWVAPLRLCLATEQKTTLRLKPLHSRSFKPRF